MPWSAVCCWLLIAISVAAGGCEKVDLPSATGTGASAGTSGGSSSDNDPGPVVGTGEGNVSYPYTVSDVQEQADLLQEREVWVVGYVVGFAYRTLENAAFTTEQAKETNILLADDPEEYDPYACLPVRLTSAKWKAALGLAQNPDSLGRCLRVLGLVGTYLKTTALTEVADYQWLGARIPWASDPGDEGEEPDPEPGTDDPQPPGDNEEGGGLQRDTLPVIDGGGVVNGGRIAPRPYRLKRRRAQP